MNEKTKDEKKTEIRPTGRTIFSPFCRPFCRVCNSGYLEEIHNLRKTMTLRELSEVFKKKYNLELLKDTLAIHFAHYSKHLRQESTLKLLEKFEQETETVSEHQRKTLFLGKIAFDHIVERIEAGTLVLGVEDFEKMLSLYYKVLRDPDSAKDDNILAIFQRASEKMGCGLEQGVLVKMPKS